MKSIPDQDIEGSSKNNEHHTSCSKPRAQVCSHSWSLRSTIRHILKGKVANIDQTLTQVSKVAVSSVSSFTTHREKKKKGAVFAGWGGVGHLPPHLPVTLALRRPLHFFLALCFRLCQSQPTCHGKPVTTPFDFTKWNFWSQSCVARADFPGSLPPQEKS